MVFEAVVDPAILGGESDQDARWSPVTRNDDLLLVREAEVVREIILDLRQSHRSQCHLSLASLGR